MITSLVTLREVMDTVSGVKAENVINVPLALSAFRGKKITNVL